MLAGAATGALVRCERMLGASATAGGACGERMLGASATGHRGWGQVVANRFPPLTAERNSL